MLGECPDDGYYRGDCCPVCDREGRFLMNDRELQALSRIIAGALRHFPEKLGLVMDGNGWVDIRDLLQALSTERAGFSWLRVHHITALVTTDPRGRYQIDGGMIRAKYGHSVNVNLCDLPPAQVDVLFYPVMEEECDLVLEQGIMPVDRRKVHLSRSIEKAVEAGSVRGDEPLILQVDVNKAQQDGVCIYQATEEVFITDKVPAEYLSRVDEKKVKQHTGKKSVKKGQ